MGLPVSGDMPIGFAGRATAGRLSGAGTTVGFLRVGLGEGVVDGDPEAGAEVGGAAVGDDEADGAGVLDARGEGDADDGDDGAVDGDGPDDCVGEGATPVGEGEPVGDAVHPASTPAQTRRLRAIVERLTSSG